MNIEWNMAKDGISSKYWSFEANKKKTTFRSLISDFQMTGQISAFYYPQQLLHAQ